MYVFSVMSCGGRQLLLPLPNVDAPDARTDYDVDYCVTHVYLSGGL